MNPSYSLMPVDRTTIKTRLRIHPDLLADPAAFIRMHDLPIRTAKLSRGNSTRGPTRNITLDVLTYKGIKIEMKSVFDDPLAVITIHFNPGVCLYGHNGRVISLTEFLHALGLLVTHLRPLLEDPADWIDLIPGLRSGGVAYWDYVEVLLQCADPDGRLLAGFRHARHPSIINPARHWPDSIQFGGQKSKFQIAIYRKEAEMAAHGKLPDRMSSDYKDILRLEVRMKEEKLVKYMGNNRNVEEIDGKKLLVWFFPQDLFRGLHKSFCEMQGVFSSDEILGEANPRGQLASLGRLLARTALDPRTSPKFPKMVDHIWFYTGASCVTKESKKKLSDAIGKIRNAGSAELSRRISISKDDLFSDASYRAQPGIASEKLEKLVCHEIEDVFVHPLITAAYRPPDQPFQPITLWPLYLRV